MIPSLYSTFAIGLKKYITILLAMLIVSQGFVQAGLLLYYHINKAYITQQLCENRKDPTKNCNGHCYLSKQLKNAEEQEKKQSQGVLKEKEEIVIQVCELLLPDYPDNSNALVFPTVSFGQILNGHLQSAVKPPAA